MNRLLLSLAICAIAFASYSQNWVKTSAPDGSWFKLAISADGKAW